MLLFFRLPLDETKSFFERQKNSAEEDLKVEKQRQQLQKTAVFKYTKNELERRCKDMNLTVVGNTKVDLALAVANAEGIQLDESESDFNGQISSIPNLSSHVRKLGTNYNFLLCI